MNESGEEACKTRGVGTRAPAASQKWHAALCSGAGSPRQVAPEEGEKWRGYGGH